MTTHVSIFDKQLEKGLHNVELLKVVTDEMKKVIVTQKQHEATKDEIKSSLFNIHTVLDSHSNESLRV